MLSEAQLHCDSPVSGSNVVCYCSRIYCCQCGAVAVLGICSLYIDKSQLPQVGNECVPATKFY